MRHFCDPSPTELIGFDSAGVLVGHATLGVFRTPNEFDIGDYPRWRIQVGHATELLCSEESVERWLRENGAVTIQKGDGGR